MCIKENKKEKEKKEEKIDIALERFVKFFFSQIYELVK